MEAIPEARPEQGAARAPEEGQEGDAPPHARKDVANARPVVVGIRGRELGRCEEVGQVERGRITAVQQSHPLLGSSSSPSSLFLHAESDAQRRETPEQSAARAHDGARHAPELLAELLQGLFGPFRRERARQVLAPWPRLLHLRYNGKLGVQRHWLAPVLRGAERSLGRTFAQEESRRPAPRPRDQLRLVQDQRHLTGGRPRKLLQLLQHRGAHHFAHAAASAAATAATAAAAAARRRGRQGLPNLLVLLRDRPASRSAPLGGGGRCGGARVSCSSSICSFHAASLVELVVQNLAAKGKRI